MSTPFTVTSNQILKRVVMKNNMHYSKQNTRDPTSVKSAAYSDYLIVDMRNRRFKFSQRGLRVEDNFNHVNWSPRPGIQNMATIATNHVAIAMGQVATTSLPCSSHFFFPTSFFLVTMARCYFFLCCIARILITINRF